MKKRFLFYTIALLIIIGLGAVIMTSATETSPTKAPESTTQNEIVPEAETPKKKSCLCCADRIERLQKKIRKARERKRATEQAEIPATPDSAK